MRLILCLSYMLLLGFLQTGNVLAENVGDNGHEGIPQSKQAGNTTTPDLTERLQAIDKQLSELRSDYVVLSKAIPSAPWWIASVVTLITTFGGACIGYWTTNRFAKRAEENADEQRRQDYAITLSKEWRDMHEEVSHANGVLDNPEILEDPDKEQSTSSYNAILTYGNWLDLLAERWNRGLVDADYLISVGMLQRIRDFWEAVQKAQTQLKTKKVKCELEKDVGNWKALKLLIDNQTSTETENVRSK